MPKEKLPEEIRDRGSVTVRTFEPFKNGKLNLRTPHGYNWLTGMAEYRQESIKRVQATARLPLQTVNGQRVVQ